MKVLFLAMVLAGVTTITYAQDRRVVIAGRAVGERGIPISQARLVLYTPPCRNCMDHVLPAAVSGSDGAFFIDSAGLPLRDLKLFMSGPVPAGFWSPIREPPFRKLSYLPGFRGKPIRIPRKQTLVDLGNVVVKLRYGKVIARFCSAPKEQSIPFAVTPLRLTVWNSRSQVVYEGPLPQQAYDSTDCAINLAIPAGIWMLEFVPGESKDFPLSSHRISVKVDRTIEINILK